MRDRSLAAGEHRLFRQGLIGPAQAVTVVATAKTPGWYLVATRAGAQVRAERSQLYADTPEALEFLGRLGIIEAIELEVRVASAERRKAVLEARQDELLANRERVEALRNTGRLF